MAWGMVGGWVGDEQGSNPAFITCCCKHCSKHGSLTSKFMRQKWPVCDGNVHDAGEMLHDLGEAELLPHLGNLTINLLAR